MGDETHRALARLIRLAAPDQHRAVLAERDVVDVERHQLAAPGEGVIGDGDQCLVSEIDQALAHGTEDLLDNLPVERRRLPLAAPPIPRCGQYPP